ncbi:unnamed protein product [Ectocarpus sp. 6 AP-2014]
MSTLPFAYQLTPNNAYLMPRQPCCFSTRLWTVSGVCALHLCNGTVELIVVSLIRLPYRPAVIYDVAHCEDAGHAVLEGSMTRFSGAIRQPWANPNPPAGSSPPSPYASLCPAYIPPPPAYTSLPERFLPPADSLCHARSAERGTKPKWPAAEDPLEGLPEEAIAALSLGAEDDLPPPRKSILTASLGPGPAKYVSIAHAVELELEAGSLEEEVPLEISITQGLAFVECPTEKGSCRAPPFDDTSTEEYLAMTFVHGPEGVTFSEDKPAKLRFFLGCVDDLAPTGDGADQASY